MKGFTVKKNQKWLKTSMIFCALTILLLAVFGQAQAWDLKAAAKPYQQWLDATQIRLRELPQEVAAMPPCALPSPLHRCRG